MKGSEIADAIVEWANNKGYHPDDFSDLFVSELLEELDEEE